MKSFRVVTAIELTCIAPMGTAVAALIFLRFWRVSNERLFLYFALAFTSKAINWVGRSIADPALESRHYVYLFRLLAFVLIIIGILDKNRRRSP